MDERRRREGQMRRRKKGNKFSLDKSMNFTMYMTAIIVVSVILAYVVMSVANDKYGFVKPYNEIQVEIPMDASTSKISKLLKQNKVVKYPALLTMYIKGKGYDGRLNSGLFDFNTNMTYGQILGVLRKPNENTNTIKVTIPEGFEIKQIVDLFAEKGICSRNTLNETLNEYPFKHEFLKEVPQRENRLEGYLFPDTYEFFKSDSSVSVVNKLLLNFDKKFSDEYKKRAAEFGMTMDEVIILASIIEREAANDKERADISAVFHNRLNSSDFPYLQSCATVQYVLKERKPVLSEKDTQIDSPYNTYINKGLPIGPISSPGLASIEAALYPSNKDYLFFVADVKNNRSLFASTFAQHQKNIKKVEKQ